MGKFASFARIHITHTPTPELKKAFEFIYFHVVNSTASSRLTTEEYHRNQVNDFLNGLPNNKDFVHMYNIWARKYNRSNSINVETGLIDEDELII